MTETQQQLEAMLKALPVDTVRLALLNTFPCRSRMTNQGFRLTIYLRPSKGAGGRLPPRVKSRLRDLPRII